MSQLTRFAVVLGFCVASTGCLHQAIPRAEDLTATHDQVEHFTAQRPFEEVLHDADTGHDVLQGLLVERDGQQIVGVQPSHAGPAQVVGDPARPYNSRQVLEFLEVVEIERIGAADG